MILDEIIKKTKEDLKKRKSDYPAQWLGRSLAYNPYVPRDVASALSSSAKEPLRIIAEVKKASPSKGVIRENFEPIRIAKEYEDVGANAISVLTEPHWFKGDIEYITQIRRYTATPLLRKDFIVDEYQILEALVYGADFILLIAKALSSKELKGLLAYAHHLGLEVLVETHDAQDVKKAIFAGANIIGINHRNLDDFSMDMSLCERLIPLLPNGKIIVAESGLYAHEQLKELNKIGVDAFLIGEHFMRQEDIKTAVKNIKEG
ncbi:MULTISPECIES: indole-3-glycerol phosphate synthase TrpC [Campylobacter]|uniref:indole-3-glycerol phosphate synthase TrpC n=1 Tax=Campylobacter TaxID=194 RepID=UPI00146FD227|nr:MULTISPECIES: indole-3-glycerol phosphate synthase TrpC [Campylobacter]MBN7288475.1 indole-3-glycerol phosphate synthase TrpC [Campylobacter curvus]MDU6827318.1 indole-3-glycerol phosphate synthase TrpC [Campylobacter sp.]